MGIFILGENRIYGLVCCIFLNTMTAATFSDTEEGVEWMVGVILARKLLFRCSRSVVMLPLEGSAFNKYWRAFLDKYYLGFCLSIFIRKQIITSDLFLPIRGGVKKKYWFFFTFSQKTETPPPPFLTTSVFFLIRIFWIGQDPPLFGEKW